MTDQMLDDVEFDDLIVVALAHAVAGPSPRAELRQQLLDRIVVEPPVPPGFAFRYVDEGRWLAHPVPGIRMKVLAMNRTAGYATLLLDIAPGTHFPAHHHHGAEECYVISGTVHTCGRRLGPGDFVHADAGTDHGELWTEEGCQVLLIVPPDEVG